MLAALSVVNTDQPILFEHFLRHYSRLGIEYFYCCFHQSESGMKRDLDRCLAAFHRYSSGRYTLWLDEEFNSRKKLTHRQALKSMAEKDSMKWMAYLDIDEFYAPQGGSIPGLVSDHEEYDVLMGVLVDRLAPDGFAEMVSRMSLFDQYPLNAFLTNDFLGGAASKVFMARSEIPVLCPGHHCVAVDSPSACPNWFPCYHFKWDSSVQQRLTTRRATFQKHGVGWWVQSERFLTDPKASWDYLSRIQEGAIELEFTVLSWSQEMGRHKRGLNTIQLDLEKDPYPASVP